MTGVLIKLETQMQRFPQRKDDVKRQGKGGHLPPWIDAGNRASPHSLLDLGLRPPEL